MAGNIPGPVARPLADRFWEKVEKTGTCWLWRGATTGGQYGLIGSGGRGVRKLLLAHRVSWELHFGPIPKGLVVRHKCDVKGCVNPEHLLVGTHRENAQDAIRSGAFFCGERHYNAKLNEHSVREIRRRGDAGEQFKSIADDFGVRPETVKRITDRMSWKHVT